VLEKAVGMRKSMRQALRLHKDPGGNVGSVGVTTRRGEINGERTVLAHAGPERQARPVRAFAARHLHRNGCWTAVSQGQGS